MTKFSVSGRILIILTQTWSFIGNSKAQVVSQNMDVSDREKGSKCRSFDCNSYRYIYKKYFNIHTEAPELESSQQNFSFTEINHSGF